MELLTNLYKIHSMSGQEDAMRNFIKKYVKENVPGAVVRQENHNLYITKGESDTYPCVVAHLDQVQRKHSADFRVLEFDGRYFGFSAKNARMEGLGADDKNGIWVALKCLLHFDVMKVAFFHSEEIGTVGSRHADMSFFKDCRFVIEPDRRNGGDLITDICGRICSDEFLSDISGIAEAHGYSEECGLLTDVETLSDNGLGISAINVSCGYYNPHTDTEYTDIEELKNCLFFVAEIIVKCTKVYPFTRQKKSYTASWGGGYGMSDWVYKNGRWQWVSGKKSSNKYYDDEEEDASTNAMNPEIETVSFSDFATPEEALFSFCCKNLNYSEFDLWDYISSDCATYGITYREFVEIYDEAFEFVCEKDEEEQAF